MQQLINKIKAFFAKEEVEVILPKQTIPFLELETWLDQRFQQNTKSVTEAAKPMLEKIEDALFALDANIKNLDHAQLRNKSISARELEIMKGNKASYIMRSRQFHGQLSSLSEKKEYADMKALVSHYTKEIEAYHAATLKPYAVLQHFFANEAYAVAKNIKDLDEAIRQLQQLLNKQSIEAINDIKKQISLVKQKCGQKEKLLAEQKQAEEEYQHFKELQDEAEEKKEKVEQSDAYQRYLLLVTEKDAAIKKTEAHMSLLRQHFSVLEKALRKFIKLHPDKEQFLLSYLEKPLEALQKDESFEIVRQLQMVKEHLLANSLEIKDDKKEKIADEITLLTEEYLKVYKAEQQKLHEIQKEFEKRCSTDFAKQHYDETTYMYKTYKEKSEAYYAEKQKISAEILALALPETVQQLQNDVQSCTKQDVVIVL